MKQWKALAAALAVLGTAMGGAPDRAQAAPAAGAAIAANQTLDKQYLAAFQRGDADTIMTLYWHSPDLVVVFPQGEAVKGWDNVRAAYRDLFARDEIVAAAVADAAYLPSGDSVFGSGRGTVTFKPQGASQTQQEVIRFTDVRQKKDGRWVIVLDHLQALAPAGPTLAAMMTATKTPTLYQRLGGYDAVAALVDDFIPRLATDPQLKRFFAGISTGRAHQLRQLFVDQLVAATGGPAVYTGRDMKTIHAGLGITGSDWDRMVVLLTQSFDKLGVGQQERTDLLAILSPLKRDIVEKP